MNRDRAILSSGLLLITALAWAYTAREARSMGDLCIPMGRPWTAADASMTWVMWFVMMVAMMTGPAAPMVLMFAAASRKFRQAGLPYTDSGIFLSGYLAVWAAFSLAATAFQWLLHSLSLLSPMMVTTNPYAGIVILLCAAIFQWTPLKTACLEHCRSPLGFFLTHWHPGPAGAFRMGLQHGAYCIGCCWALMALLFVAGAMNLLWIAILSAFVLAEKVSPRAGMITRCGGAVLLLLAMASLKQALH